MTSWPRRVPGRPPTSTGQPVRCASNIHADRPAEVRGTFLYSVIRDAPDQPGVHYCRDCASALQAVGWFRPDSDDQPNPGEG